MICNKNQLLPQEGKKPIVYDVFFEETKTPKPIVIFCHGYKGFKDWGAWNLVAEKFAVSGLFFIKFNFSHNGGTPQQPVDFPDLEAFAQNNYSKELDDLQRILDFITLSEKYNAEIDTNDITVIGHSRGGGIVLLKAEESDLISKVVTWAGVSDYKVRFQEGSESFKAWKETGRTFVENGRTKQQMPHDWQFYEDFKKNEHRLTISKAVKALDKPLLLIHGSEDSTVLPEEAAQLHRWNKNSDLVIIEGADHVFNARHPWSKKKLPENLQNVVATTIEFVKK